MSKDFGYNYDDSYYFYKTYESWGQTVLNNTGWVIYPNTGKCKIEKDNKYFRTPIINNLNGYFGVDDNVNINDGENNKQLTCYFQYQQMKKDGTISKPIIFQNDNNKVSIDIYKIPEDLGLTYLPLTILFTTNINIKDKIIIGNNNYSDNNNDVYEVLNVNIYRNPTSTPVPTTQKPVIDPGICV